MAGFLPIVEGVASVSPGVFGVINTTVHSIESLFGSAASGADKKAAAMQAAAGILGLYNLGTAVLIHSSHAVSDQQMQAISTAIDSAVQIANAFGDFTHAPKTVQAS